MISRFYIQATVLLVLLMQAYVLQAKTKAMTDYSKTPVLFVHGHGLYANNWNSILSALQQQGYPDTYLSAIQITPNRMANKTAAETVIEPAVTALLQQAGRVAASVQQAKPSKVDIVSHSMGAVSSRWYAAKIAPQKVRTWLSLAAANHGSNALCQHADEGARDLCPAFATTSEQSEIQLQLNGTVQKPLDETPYGIGQDPAAVPSVQADAERSILYIGVRIDPDEWIVPADSAVLAGAGGVQIELPAVMKETTPGNYLFSRPGVLKANTVGHMSLLEDKDLIAFVVDALQVMN